MGRGKLPSRRRGRSVNPVRIDAGLRIELVCAGRYGLFNQYGRNGEYACVGSVVKERLMCLVALLDLCAAKSIIM